MTSSVTISRGRGCQDTSQTELSGAEGYASANSEPSLPSAGGLAEQATASVRRQVDRQSKPLLPCAGVGAQLDGAWRRGGGATAAAGVRAQRRRWPLPVQLDPQGPGPGCRAAAHAGEQHPLEPERALNPPGPPRPALGRLPALAPPAGPGRPGRLRLRQRAAARHPAPQRPAGVYEVNFH